MKHLYRIYFKAGPIINVTAENFTYTYSNLSGEIIGYKFINPEDQVPKFMDLSNILAITEEEVF